VARPAPAGALLLELLRGESPPGEADARWPETLALAARHGVAPLLHATVRGLPPGAAAALRTLRAASLRDSLWREQGLLRAVARLPDAIAFKGAAAATELYDSPELRPSADIDLLHPEAGEIPGYRWHEATRAQESRAQWHERTFVDPLDARVLIDLHRSLSQPERTRVDIQALCARARPGAHARVLDPDDAVLVQALNLATHELRSPLISVVDLARLWQRCRPAVVRERARAFRLEGALFAALALLAACAGEAGQFGGAAVPRLPLPDPGPLSGPLLRWAVSRYDLSRRPLGRLEQLVRKASFIDRPVDRVRFGVAEVRRRVAAALPRE
jgi:hypothetical protein